MAQTLKVLGQADLGATTLTSVYTVPGGTTAALSSVVFCNRNVAARTIRWSVAVASAADDPKQYLAYGMNVPANDSLAFPIGVSLGPADQVRAWASAVDVSVSIFGVEQT